MTKPNLYLKALEIGFESGNNGISYDNLVRQLVNQNYKINEDVFWIWYLRNFEHRLRAYFSVDPSGLSYNEQPSKSDPHELCADSVMQYIEYIELKESRESAIKALKHSKYAIYIAIISIILNVFFSESIFGTFNNRQKTIKTGQEMESQVKEALEYQNGISVEANNQQKKSGAQDTISHEEIK